MEESGMSIEAPASGLPRARPAKTRRIEMRADLQSEALIARAAAAAGQSVSAFVLGAAVREADQILARADTTVMSAEQFDALIATLETPDRADRLATAASAARRFVRR
jgi:uncharacterized protein (DUF1778 family)